MPPELTLPDQSRSTLATAARAIEADLRRRSSAPIPTLEAASLGFREIHVDEVARRLQDLGLPRERLAATFSHSHTTPKVNGACDAIFSSPIPPEHQAHIDRYTEELVAAMERAARESIADLQPARLERAVGQVGFAQNRGEPLLTELRYPVQTWTFGDSLEMVFLAGEVCVDYALRLKRALDPDRLWLHGYANDFCAYIPSERLLREGGYGGGAEIVYFALPNVLAPGLEDKIVAEVMRQSPESIRQAGAQRASADEALAPAESIAAMQPRPELVVELEASEPQIADPVAIDFGPDGKVWVAAIPRLRELALALRPAVRVQAMCALDGLGGLDDATLLRALCDEDPRVQRHAVRLSEPRLAAWPEGLTAVCGLANAHDGQLLMQTAYSLGATSEEQAAVALARLAWTHRDDPYLAAAALSSVGQAQLSTVGRVVVEQAQRDELPEGLFQPLMKQTIAAENSAAVAQLLTSFSRLDLEPLAAWQWSAAVEVLTALRRAAPQLRDDPALQPPLAALDAIARRAVLDAPTDEQSQAAAVQLLSLEDDALAAQAAAALASAVDANRAQVVADYLAASVEEGVAARGRGLFEKHCASCHALQGTGYAVGPDLAAITNRSRPAWTEAILDPNRAVDERYRTYTALTSAGLARAGILRGETSTSVTLVEQRAAVYTLLRSDLERFENSGRSLMPEGLEQDMSPQDVVDVIAYVNQQSSQSLAALRQALAAGTVHLEELSDEQRAGLAGDATAH